MLEVVANSAWEWKKMSQFHTMEGKYILNNMDHYYERFSRVMDIFDY